MTLDSSLMPLRGSYDKVIEGVECVSELEVSYPACDENAMFRVRIENEEQHNDACLRISFIQAAHARFDQWSTFARSTKHSLQHSLTPPSPPTSREYLSKSGIQCKLRLREYIIIPPPQQQQQQPPPPPPKNKILNVI